MNEKVAKTRGWERDQASSALPPLYTGFEGDLGLIFLKEFTDLKAVTWR